MNSLAKIFSDEEVEFVGKIHFNDVKAKNNFVQKLKQSIENGLPLGSEIEELFLKSIDDYYPYPLYQSKEVVTSLEFEDKGLELLLKDERKVIFHEQKENHNILKTQINNITLTLNLDEEDDCIGFSYDIDFEESIDTKDALYAVETTLMLLRYIFGISKNNFSQQPKSVKEIFNFFFSYYVLFYPLKKIEEVTDKTFKIDNTLDLENDLEDTIVLYTFLVKQKPLYLPYVTVKNIKFDVNEPDFVSPPAKNEFTELLLPKGSKAFQLFGQTIDLFCLDLINNVFIQNVETVGAHERIVINESSSRPMRYFTQGFSKSIENINEEEKVEIIEKLKKAKEWSDYYDQLHEELEARVLRD